MPDLMKYGVHVSPICCVGGPDHRQEAEVAVHYAQDGDNPPRYAFFCTDHYTEWAGEYPSQTVMSAVQTGFSNGAMEIRGVLTYHDDEFHPHTLDWKFF